MKILQKHEIIDLWNLLGNVESLKFENSDET